MPISLSTPPSTSRLLFVTNIPSLSSLSSSLSPLSPLAFYNDAREAYVIDRQLITANYLFSFSPLTPLYPPPPLLAFYNDAREAYVIDRQLITANYLFSFWFPVDVVSSIPIDTFVAISSGTFQVD